MIKEESAMTYNVEVVYDDHVEYYKAISDWYIKDGFIFLEGTTYKIINLHKTIEVRVINDE